MLLFQGVHALGKSGLCSRQLVGNWCKVLAKYWPIKCGPTMWSHENGQILHRSYGSKSKKIWVWRLQVQNLVPARTFCCAISIKIYPSLVICIHNIISCIGWLHICFTCERCDISSINKRTTKVAAGLKIIVFTDVAAWWSFIRPVNSKNEARESHRSATKTFQDKALVQEVLT